MRSKSLFILLMAIVAACIRSNVYAHSPMDKARAGDLAQLVERSNLVFVGTAEKVAYRNGRGDKGEGLVPYTIVTYRVGQVLRGKPPGREITMRFVGGPDGRGHFLSVSGVPVIQKGDQDLLFVGTTADATCPLVFCEFGRYRVLNEQVFDTHGSPVRAIVKSTVVSRGLPPKEFQTVQFPRPSFDDLIKNREVAEQLKSEKISLEDARRRYEAEAPRSIELTEDFPVPEKGADSGEAQPTGAAAPGATGQAPPESTELPERPIALSEFVAAIQRLAKESKRPAAPVRSVNAAAPIVAARVGVTAPQRLKPPAPAPVAPGSADEYKAYEQNGYDPVIRK